MLVLDRRVVISQGSVSKEGNVHLPGAMEKSEVLPITPRPRAPLQKAWWSPRANLPGLQDIKYIHAARAPITNWDSLLVTVKSDVVKSTKVALQVCAVAAETRTHTADVGLGRADIGKLHTNKSAAGSVTITLPNAAPGLRGAEIFIEVAEGQTLEVKPATGGAIPDTLMVDGNDKTLASANAVNERMVIKWVAKDVWKVDEHTANWTFTP